MTKCTFCGAQIEQGTGKMLAKNSGDIIFYCSNKCEKNNRKLNRVPRNVMWTEAYRKEKTSSQSSSKKKKEA